MMHKRDFDTKALHADFAAAAKRHKVSIHKALERIGVQYGTYRRMGTGEIRAITVITLARMLDYIGNYDIQKYIIEE